MQVGPYSLESELARGGVGVVYRARDTRDGSEVALKLLTAPSPVVRRRFRTESEALLRLSHPNLVRALEAGQHDAGPWLALELVPGESLGERLERGQTLAPARAAELVQVLCEALAHAHAHGVLHRDVKPDNVVLRPDGQPVLVDFGLARDLDAERSRVSVTGVFVGTPGYWAPEQARGDLSAVGPATDVYGLGATLYALIAGHPPVVGDSLVDFLASGSFKRIAPLTELHPHVAPALWAVCARSLAYAPADRPPTPGDLAQALRAAHEPPAPRRAPVALAAVALALAALSAGGAYALWRSSRRPGDAVARSAPAPTAPASALDAEGLERALRDLVDRGELDAARDLLVDACEAHPDEARPWTLRAKLEFEQGVPREALRLLERALAVDPDAAGPLHTRCSLLSYLGYVEPALADARRLVARTDLDPVVATDCAQLQDSLEAALAHLDPGRPPSARSADRAAHLAKARAAIERRDLTLAEREICKATYLDPESSAPWVLRSRVEHARERWSQARLAAARALELTPNAPEGLQLLGLACLRLERPQVALDVLQRGLARHPDHPDLLLSCGSTLATLGRYEGALSLLRRRVEVAPHRAEGWTALGHLQLQLGDLQEGHHALSEARRLVPAEGREAFDRELAQRLDTSGLRQGAPDPDDEKARIRAQIDALARDHRLDEAFALLDASFAADSGVYFGLRGLIEVHAAQPSVALADFDRALELTPELHAARLTRGQLCRDLFLWERARADFAHLADLEGDAPELATLRELARPRLQRVEAHLRGLRPLLAGPRSVLAVAEFSRAAEDAHTGKLERAYQGLSESLSLEPARAQAWALRGAVRNRLGLHAGALFDASRAIELAPSDPNPWLLRAQIHAGLKDWRAAIEDAEHCLELGEPERPEVLLRVYGRCLGGAGRHAEAVDMLERALELDPALALDWLAYATSLSHLDREADARAAIEEGLRRATPLDRDEVERAARGLLARLDGR